MLRTSLWIVAALTACGGSSPAHGLDAAAAGDAAGAGDAATKDGNGSGAPAACTPAGGRPALVDVATNTTSCALYADGHIACWGLGAFGELGDGQATHAACGTSDCATTPVRVSDTDDAIAVAVGGDNACALHAGGTVTCWGDASAGALGDGVTTHGTTCDFTDCSRVPVAVTGLSDAVAVSVGVGEACAVRRGGQVACWGMNDEGQLGDGSATHASCTLGTQTVDCSRAPVTVANLSDAVEVSVGSSFVCARRAGGGVACWGEGTLGVLGDGTLDGSATPVAVTGVTDAVAIRSGVFDACALRASGAVACWGWDDTGMLGDGSAAHQACQGAAIGCSPTPVGVTDLDDAVALAGQWDHACAARASGVVVCWGDDSHGELGTGSAAPESSPGPHSTLPLAAVGVTAPVAVTASAFSSCALAADCSVACWGYNEYGQLGDGTTTDRGTAVTVLGL